jgi:sortase A
MAPGAPISPLAGGRTRRSTARRLVRDISSVLIITGLLLLLDAAVTLLWQEPVTAVVALIKRSEIDKRYLSLNISKLPSLDRRALGALRSDRARIAFLAARESRQVGTGDAVGRLVIPRIGLNLLVVQGTDEASLEKGPGHYPMTALPGLGRTVAIAGHRTTYLAPFRHLDAVRPGDRISLQMPYGRFVYTVQFHRIVSPSALWVIRNVGYDRLVLSACNPLYSAAQRIIVFARLSRVRALPSTGADQRSSIAGVLPMWG